MIYLGSDHAGFKLKEKVKCWLVKKKINFVDLGNVKLDKNDDYPDYAKKVAKAVVMNKSKGVLLCGSAEGMCIAANKVKGVRAVNPSNIVQTRLSRKHEDANILCLAGGKSKIPQPAMPFSTATRMIKIFLQTKFSKAARHKRRVNKIKRMEK